MIHYFNSQTGLPATPDVEAGENLVKQGLAIKKEGVPEDVESWRLSLDLDTNAVVVYAEGKDEGGAQDQKKIDIAAELQAGKDKEKADAKVEADRQVAAGEVPEYI